MKTYITLIDCPDRKGLVAAASGAISQCGGSVLDNKAHADADHPVPAFLMRFVWQMPGDVKLEDLGLDAALERAVGGTARTHDAETRLRVAILATRERHCLDEIVGAVRRGEADIEIAFIGSNQPDLEIIVEKEYGIGFRHFPIDPAVNDAKSRQEHLIQSAVKESRADIVFLAKYMQVLSAGFIEKSPLIVNVHHSFLPAFKGGNAYRQAYDRGVKIIGATTHIATENLDEGPIILQKSDVVEGCPYEEFVYRGRVLERLVSVETLRALSKHRVIRYDNKTIVL